MKRLSRTKILSILKVCYPYLFSPYRLSDIVLFEFHKNSWPSKPCYEIELPNGLAAQLRVTGHNELSIQPLCNPTYDLDPCSWVNLAEPYIYLLEV